MMATTGDEDYGVGRASVVVNNGDWFDDDDHDEEGYD
jgi:hypothetical protein